MVGSSSSLFSTVLGTQLPGEGTIYLDQSSHFVRPVYLNDTITANVEVSEIDQIKGQVTLKTTAINQKGKTSSHWLCRGYAAKMKHELLIKMLESYASSVVKSRAHDIDEKEEFPAETVKELARYGLLGLPFPTQWGA